LRAPVEAILRKNLTGRGHRPTAQVRIAELGNEAGLVGAADLAQQH
jgi:glucokinase